MVLLKVALSPQPRLHQERKVMHLAARTLAVIVVYPALVRLGDKNPH